MVIGEEVAEDEVYRRSEVRRSGEAIVKRIYSEGGVCAENRARIRLQVTVLLFGPGEGC